MFHLYINPLTERIWRLQFEPATGGKHDPVDIRALTFQDAIHDWWESGLPCDVIGGTVPVLPHDIPIELGSTIGGVLTLYIEDDQLTICDVTSDYDSDSVSCAELVERRKQERMARKARTK